MDLYAPFFYLITYLFCLYDCIIDILFSKKIRQNATTSTMVITTTSRMDQYIETQKDRFLKTFDNDTVNYNENIEECFYDKKQFLEIIADEHNALEKKWKQRMLFENTPRGNIIMFYDAFKRGFSYYSDQCSIPYTLLNAVAMKYVIIFRCRDLFMDNQIVDEECMYSPLIKIAEMEEKRERDEKKEKNKNTMITEPKNAPFAKFKTYNTLSTKVTDNTKDDEKPKNLFRNSIISLGKLVNCKLLKSEIKINKQIKTSLALELENDNQIQKNIMNYREFKKRQMKSAE